MAFDACCDGMPMLAAAGVDGLVRKTSLLQRVVKGGKDFGAQTDVKISSSLEARDEY